MSYDDQYDLIGIFKIHSTFACWTYCFRRLMHIPEKIQNLVITDNGVAVSFIFMYLKTNNTCSTKKAEPKMVK